MPRAENRIVMSLSGSLIMPGCEVNTSYLINFADLLKVQIEEHDQSFAIVTGGGPLARLYQEALRKAGVTDQKEFDRVGIRPTHQNALLLTDILNARGVTAEYLYYPKKHGSNVSVWLTGGTKPGQSTDAPAVDWARMLGYRQVINISTTPHVYRYKPGTTIPDTQKPVRQITHGAYLRMVGVDHVPGENVPAGRAAIKMARQHNIDFIVVGSDLQNLTNVLNGKLFRGTRLHT